MATDLELKVDTRLLTEALATFSEIYGNHPNDGFREEFLALHDDGRMFTVVHKSGTLSLQPSNEFKFLLEEMTI